MDWLNGQPLLYGPTLVSSGNFASQGQASQVPNSEVYNTMRSQPFARTLIRNWGGFPAAARKSMAPLFKDKLKAQ